MHKAKVRGGLCHHRLARSTRKRETARPELIAQVNQLTALIERVVMVLEHPDGVLFSISKRKFGQREFRWSAGTRHVTGTRSERSAGLRPPKWHFTGTRPAPNDLRTIS